MILLLLNIDISIYIIWRRLTVRTIFIILSLHDCRLNSILVHQTCLFPDSYGWITKTWFGIFNVTVDSLGRFWWELIFLWHYIVIWLKTRLFSGSYILSAIQFWNSNKPTFMILLVSKANFFIKNFLLRLPIVIFLLF